MLAYLYWLKLWQKTNVLSWWLLRVSSVFQIIFPHRFLKIKVEQRQICSADARSLCEPLSSLSTGLCQANLLHMVSSPLVFTQGCWNQLCHLVLRLNQSGYFLGSESTPAYGSLSLETFAWFSVHSFPGEIPMCIKQVQFCSVNLVGTQEVNSPELAAYCLL